MIRSNFLANASSARMYVEGVRRLKDPAISPWPGRQDLSLYDVFVMWHHNSMMMMTPPGQTDRNAAHSGPSFLPWHRYFLLTLERLLQQTLNDETFRIPYWDFCADAALPNPTTSEIWSAANLGQFVQPEWRVRLAMNGSTGNLMQVDRTLLRQLGRGGRLPSRNEAREVLQQESVYDQAPFNSSSSGGMRNRLEGWVGPARLHNNVHVWVGGDMSLSSSPNDPVFFLHHCNIDRMWAGWQQSHSQSDYLPDMTAGAELQFHRIDDPLYSVFEEIVTSRDMLQYQAHYQYDSFADLV